MSRSEARNFSASSKKPGLENVRIDAGNVIGVRAGAAAHPNVVFAAHLDTVFPEGTDVQVTRDGNLLRARASATIAAGWSSLLGMIRALREANVKTPGTITFVADIGEEGLGDLRGTKNIFDDSLHGQIDKFVSIDGTGISVTNVGVGSYRYRTTFKGPGGHSFGSFGMANPIQAMGRAIAKIDAFEVPTSPGPRSTSAASAAVLRSMRFRSNAGWKSTCDPPTRLRSKQ